MLPSAPHTPASLPLHEQGLEDGIGEYRPQGYSAFRHLAAHGWHLRPAHDADVPISRFESRPGDEHICDDNRLRKLGLVGLAHFEASP